MRSFIGAGSQIRSFLTLAHRMNDKAYPKWVGVILAFLLHGSAHYLAGDRVTGLKWYFGIAFTAITGILILAIPGVAGFAAAIVTLLIALLLWLRMLTQSYRPVPRIRIWGWLAVIAINLVLNTGWQYAIRLVVHPFKVPTGAMIPAIMPGDHVVAERLTYRFTRPKRGDIVVFSTSGLEYPAVKQDTFYIKRIAGLPGETIQIAPPHLLVNGRPVTDPAIFGDISSTSNGFLLARTSPGFTAVLDSTEDKMVLGEHEYLTLGDNTTSCLDGRYYGPISEDQIFGRISRVYRPLSRIGK